MFTKLSHVLAFTALLVQAASGFAPTAASSSGIASKITTSFNNNASRESAVKPLQMANEDDLLRWARSSRSAGADDNVVEVVRPIGVVLAEDEKGNVYVETLAPKGNAARTGKVSQQGKSIVYCLCPTQESLATIMLYSRV